MDALRWCEHKKSKETRDYRDEKIKLLHERLKENRNLDIAWRKKGGPLARQISAKVQGATFEQLAVETKFKNIESVDMLIGGAHMIGKLPNTGLGDPIDPITKKTLSTSSCKAKSNVKDESIHSQTSDNNHHQNRA